MTKKRKVTEQEKELWHQAMKDVKKLDKNIQETTKKIDTKHFVEKCPDPENVPQKIFDTRQLQPIDRNLLKKVKQGKIQIEACLDLHGMTQDQAYAALQKFISSCQINGKKFVLIITGKGGMDLGENDRPKGVLKQNVPKWLQAFSAVLSIAPALRKHGGDGALYVILKREN